MHSLPAPVRGWIENENLANNAGAGASVLENWFPLTSTVRVRSGYVQRAYMSGGGGVGTMTVGSTLTVGGSSSSGGGVVSLVPYESGALSKFFAVSADSIYDISALSASSPGTLEWANLNSGVFAYTQMATAGGEFLVMANESSFDYLMVYDGANWFPLLDEAVSSLSYDALTADFTIGATLTGGTSGATATILGITPATSTTGTLVLGAISTGPFQDDETITDGSGGSATANGTTASVSTATITGQDTSTFSHVWSHGSRLWFVESGTMTAHYLPVDQIGGAVSQFELGGVFRKGGSLWFGATWSADSGAGPTDRNVFVSTEGEVAIYSGTDPSSADTWSLLGLYEVGKPVSTRTMKAGSDLLIATTDGIVPLSQIVMKDPAALSVAAVTFPVETAWRRVQSLNSASAQVQMLKWQQSSMGIIGYPHMGTSETHVVNLQTGAWAKWTGHDIQCLAMFGGKAYFGDSNGLIHEIEAAGSDNGDPYVCRACLLPDHLQSMGVHKVVRMARATFRSLASFRAKLSVAMDYRRDFPSPPQAMVTSTTSSSVWDVGEWDVAVWDDAPNSDTRVTATTRWRSIGRSGFAAAPQVMITCGSERRPDAELVTFDVLFEGGGVVV